MLKLATSKAVFSKNWDFPNRNIRLTGNPLTPDRLRKNLMLLVKSASDLAPEGFGGYLFVGHERLSFPNSISLPNEFSYLDNDDVIFADSEANHVRSLFRAKVFHNSFLLTERCNHYCVMCSQPPRDVDDGYLATNILNAIPLLPQYTRSLGLTGGEPTLLGDGLLDIIKACKQHLPDTSLHILSNGTTFRDNDFAAKIAAIEHPDLMFGIPLYSNIPETHNFVVQSPNAWDSTIHGILNLKGNGVKVEVRVVLHKFTIPTLADLAKFLSTNLLFVDQVAFMGLEATGFAKTNWNDLWIHPKEYQQELLEAVTTCTTRGMKALVFNLPLCWLDPLIHRHAVKSISDWKNDYPDACNTCAAFTSCGGFFSSNLAKGATDELSPYTAATLPRFG
ncbi:MAG: His-Xaa-Ser system radical SAM maturase HxsC [Verrucomicrobiota bacterium]